MTDMSRYSASDGCLHFWEVWELMQRKLCEIILKFWPIYVIYKV